ncbi:hypothetical protein LCGC14_1613800 [marine sediment metagenome]|uniref:Protein NO VEIN C-terminal domain-containing protein n=1 Tax=marine sediment metagenome TaxID=412755 RepID=A0A0F9I7S8_9ZZZZ
MIEGDLTTDLVKACKKSMTGAVIIKHADRSSYGIPDLSITWQKATTWWEVKFFNNKPFNSPEQQEIMCQKLSTQGHCHYVIYKQQYAMRSILIVNPFHINEWDHAAVGAAAEFNHTWVAQFIHALHLNAASLLHLKGR